MKPLLIFSTIGLLFFLSCNKKSKQLTPVTYTPYTIISLPADVIGPAIELDSFPLAVGNQWVYNTQEQAYNSQGEIYLNTYTDTFTVISDTFVNGIVFHYIASSNFANTTSLLTADYDRPGGAYYYTFMPNGLHQFASLANTDSVYIADSSEYVLLLPATINYSWNSREKPSFLLDPTMVRSWVSYVTATTPAGSFNCVKMHISTVSTKLEAYQYYSSKGLVQEIQQIEGLSMGPQLGPTYITRIMTLTAVNF